MNYKQIKRFTRENLAKRLKNIDITPIWLSERYFVYQREGEIGSEYIFVDCVEKKKEKLKNYSKILTPTPNPYNRLTPNHKYNLLVNNYNLFRQELSTGEQLQLTFDGREDFAYSKIPGTCRIPLQIENGIIPWSMPGLFSPDGAYFLTHQLDERQVKLFHIQNNANTGRAKHYQFHHAYAGDSHLTYLQLILINIAKGSVKRLHCDPLLVEFFTVFDLKNWLWWSKDSKKIYYLRNYRGYKRLSLCEYNLDTEAEVILLEEFSKTYIEPNQIFFWDANVYLLEDSNEILWWSERDDWGHLYLYDKTTGQLKNQVTRGEWLVLDILFVDEKHRQVYFTGCGREKGDPYYRYLYCVKLDGSKLTCLTAKQAEHAIFPSPQFNFFVDTYSTITTAPITTLCDRDGQIIMTLEEANITILEAYNWQKPELFSLLALDGITKLYGAIFKPSYFDASKKYPIIADIYPGPMNNHVPKAMYCNGDKVAYRWPGMWQMQALAECGFIVVCLDTPGSAMRSKSFRDVSYGRLQEGSLAEHIAILKALSKTYTYMDIERVGITGHSAGGYIAARALLLYPDFFKVAVAGSGIHDLKNFMAYWSEKYQGLVETGNYENQSNNKLAHMLKGKLLLIHGEMDDNVHVQHSIHLYQSLLSAGKNHLVELLILPNTYHECNEHPVYLENLWNFFIKNLK
ncbi:alpha/beta fold hydrolase [Legionella sp. D16C41]|uniref:S9 family peptidase n=1 Tax=Legionella sp. D16C41 TaxID=3402688 RepID=UPI003AF7D6F7